MNQLDESAEIRARILEAKIRGLEAERDALKRDYTPYVHQCCSLLKEKMKGIITAQSRLLEEAVPRMTFHGEWDWLRRYKETK